VPDGDRLLKCPSCEYMLVPRAERTLTGEPLIAPAGRGK
jgi:hypothetical protein